MNKLLMSMRVASLAGISLLLSGCGGSISNVKLWPFGGDTAQERSRAPLNATEYQCAAGKRFHVRKLDGGAAVWLILPEREVRLDKTEGSTPARYSNGIAVLELNGAEATLSDGAAAPFSGCKSAVAP